MLPVQQILELKVVSVEFFFLVLDQLATSVDSEMDRPRTRFELHQNEPSGLKQMRKI